MTLIIALLVKLVITETDKLQDVQIWTTPDLPISDVIVAERARAVFPIWKVTDTFTSFSDLVASLPRFLCAISKANGLVFGEVKQACAHSDRGAKLSGVARAFSCGQRVLSFPFMTFSQRFTVLFSIKICYKLAMRSF